MFKTEPLQVVYKGPFWQIDLLPLSVSVEETILPRLKSSILVVFQ